MKISTFIFKNNLERLAKNGYIYLKVHRKNDVYKIIKDFKINKVCKTLILFYD